MILLFKSSIFSLIVFIDSIVSTNGLRSSLESGGKTSFKVFIKILGLYSFDNLGLLICKIIFINSSKESLLLNPYNKLFTIFLYSLADSTKLLFIPKLALNSNLVKGVLLKPSFCLYSSNPSCTLRPSFKAKPKKSVCFPRFAVNPIPIVIYFSFLESKNSMYK